MKFGEFSAALRNLAKYTEWGSYLEGPEYDSEVVLLEYDSALGWRTRALKGVEFVDGKVALLFEEE